MLSLTFLHCLFVLYLYTVFVRSSSVGAWYPKRKPGTRVLLARCHYWCLL